MSAIKTEIRLDRPALNALETSFRGQLVRPGDAGYDEHRKVWNGSVDRSPALIARCAGVADVIAALRFARAGDLRVAVRGGGHSFPGQSVCDGGVVIDLGPMKGIRVDPQARTARAQAGVLLGRARPRDAGVRARDDRRDRDPHRDRRPDARRRHRLASAQVRPDHRPADLGRPGHRGRRVRARERRREPRPLLGPARRRRKLRHRHRVRVSPAPGRSDRARRTGVLADRAGAGRAALLSRLDRRRAGRADDDRHPPQGAGAPVRAPRAARPAGRRGRVLLRGPGRGGRAGAPAAEGVRITGAGPVRAQALPRPSGDVRSDPSRTASGTTCAPATSPSSPTRSSTSRSSTRTRSGPR